MISDENHTVPQAQAEDPLGAIIRERRWDAGVELIRERLALAESDERRAFYESFLATFYKTMLRDRRFNRDAANVDRLRREAGAALNRAVALSPRNVVIRTALAEFHLKHVENPAAALDLLGPFGPDDTAPSHNIIAQDHKRLALRGLAHALLGDPARAAAEFNEAYGPAFQSQLERSYKTPLWTLAKRGGRLPALLLDPILENLRRFPRYNDAALARLRAGLIEI